MLKSCPQCGQQLNPPIQSISRQVCYQCGWSGEVILSSPNSQQNEVKNNSSSNLVKFLQKLNHKKILLISTFLGIGCFSLFFLDLKNNFNYQPANQALDGIISKLEVGLSYREYGDEIKNAKVLVDRVADADLQRRLNGHLAVYELWRCRFLDSGLQNNCYRESYENFVFPLFPELKEKMAQILEKEKADCDPSDRYSLCQDLQDFTSYIYGQYSDFAMEYIWKTL